MFNLVVRKVTARHARLIGCRRQYVILDTPIQDDVWCVWRSISANDRRPKYALGKEESSLDAFRI